MRPARVTTHPHVIMNDGQGIRYVLDTDTVSAHQRDHPRVLARVAVSNPDTVGTTVVTLYEQLRGRMAVVARARDDQTVQAAYQWLQRSHQYFCNVIVLPFDAAATANYRSLTDRRIRIGMQDLRIAAIALAYDAILVTGNRRDFERVPRLRIEDWTIEEP